MLSNASIPISNLEKPKSILKSDNNKVFLYHKKIYEIIMYITISELPIIYI